MSLLSNSSRPLKRIRLNCQVYALESIRLLRRIQFLKHICFPDLDFLVMLHLNIALPLPLYLSSDT